MLACGFPSEAPVPLMITVDARHTPQSHQTLQLMICFFPPDFSAFPLFQAAIVPFFFFFCLNCNVLKDNNACYVWSWGLRFSRVHAKAFSTADYPPRESRRHREAENLQ